MRRMLPVLSTLVGLGLLASAYLTATASPATGERVLRLNVSTTDIKYLDPALNYDFYGWRLESATCAMLLGYPDKVGPANARLYPEVSRGFPKVTDGGRMYTFTIRQGIPLLRRDGGDRRELRASDRAGAQPEDAVVRGIVPRRRRGRRQGARGQGDAAVRGEASAATRSSSG